SPTHRLVKDRTALVITPKSVADFVSATVEEGQTSLEREGRRLTFDVRAREGFRIPPSPLVACLDAQAMQYPLKVRSWKAGDWFCPLGMNQKKKISDFLIDEKVPLNLKERVLVLTSNGSVAWIVGHRIDNRFKITDKTERVLVVSVATVPSSTRSSSDGYPDKEA
ncbi:MAG: tRNA lysidine(34) synthetase TilS, partial [Ferruginibacter sp.]|nr:tRNA lysidine(34) synthetase TilS [Cytophagales bacterium]